MRNTVYDAIKDWHRCVVDKLSCDEPKKLAEYALHISRIIAYPNLDINKELLKIDVIGEKISQSTNNLSQLRPTQIIERINNQLFSIENFTGNKEDYYNPSNSFLNIVLKRKLGIPITLSILYIRVANLLNFQLSPVNFPSHFMIKHVLDVEGGEIIIDPYNEGRIMDDYSLKVLLDQTYPRSDISLTRKFVGKAPDSKVLLRMLNNLKTSYFECNDIDKAELANEMILDIDASEQNGIRDKGMISLKNENHKEALGYFIQYLERYPEAEDADTILEIIRKIKTKV